MDYTIIQLSYNIQVCTYSYGMMYTGKFTQECYLNAAIKILLRTDLIELVEGLVDEEQ